MAVRGSNSLYFDSGIDTSGLKAGASEASGIVQGLANTIGKIGPFGILASAAATAFAKIGSDAYKMVREFEQAMKEVETISKATQDDFEGISEAVFALSKISPEGPAKLAKAYYQIVSAGFDGAKGLKLLEISTKAATAGVTTTEKAADGLTTVLNAFKLEAEDAERVSDILFTTVRLGKTTIDELSNSLSEVAPLAASSGYNFEEVAAAVATLTKQGVPTSKAMTQIRAAIEATTEILGDGAAESMTLQNAFQAIYDKAGGSQNELKELVGTIEGVSAILATSGKNAEGAQKDLLEYANAAGATADATKRMLGSNINQWDILGNRIKATTENVGDSLVKMSSGVAKFFNDALDDGEDLQKSFDQQRIEIYKLKGAIEETNEGSEEFKDLRKQIIDQYPEFVSGIDSEKASTEDLLIVLDKVNQAYILRYKFEKRQDELKAAYKKLGDIELNIENAEDEFNTQFAALQALADNKNIKLNINPDLEGFDLIDDLRDQLEDVKGAVRGGVQDQGFGAVPQSGFADEILNNLRKSARAQKELNAEYRERKGIVDDLIGRNKRLSQTELETSEGQEEAIRRINKAMKEADLSNFTDSGIKPIEDAIDARRKLIEQFRTIDAAENLKSLKPFLDSQIDEIKEYAEERSRYLNKNYDDDNDNGDKDGLKELQKELKETERKYEDYFNLVRRGYKDLADKNYDSLLQQGDDFEEYLDRRIEASKNAAEKEALILAKDNTRRTLLSPQSFGYSQNQIDRSSNSKVEIETGDLEKSILKSSKEALKEFEELAKNISSESDDKTDDPKNKLEVAMYKLADALYGVADIYFELSGDDQGANRIAQFAGVAEGVGMIASGNVIGGAVKALTSAISVEIDSNTAMYEQAIARLEKTIEKLDYTISQSTGSERINSRQQAIDQLKEIEEQAKLAEEAEKEAEKQVKILGLTIAKKGKGSGTDQAKLEELQDKAEEARREVAELNRELNELFTGTTADSITDSIIQGFRDGYTAVEDFASNFEETMKNALLNAFKVKYLEDEVAKFYEQFAEFGEDQNFSAQEISALRELYGAMIEGAENDINAINDILEGSGLRQLGGDPSNNEGLSGGIKSITEDTAAEINGYMNAVRIDVRQGLQVAIQSGVYLSEIAQNTRYNRHLETMDRTLTSLDGKMKTIENGIMEFQSRS